MLAYITLLLLTGQRLYEYDYYLMKYSPQAGQALVPVPMPRRG